MNQFFLFFYLAKADSFTITEVGSLTAVFLISMGILRLFGWYLKSRESSKHEACQLSEDLVNKIHKLYDIHCGKQAIIDDGVPRWYLPDKLEEHINSKLDRIELDIREIKDTLK